MTLVENYRLTKVLLIVLFWPSDLRRPRQKEVRHVRRARILYAIGFATDWPVNPAVPNFRAADEPLLAV